MAHSTLWLKRIIKASALVTILVTHASFANHSEITMPQPGSSNAITDVNGLKVGQYQRNRDGYLTGTTVIYAPHGARAGVNVAGGGPGTRETDLLDPRNLVQKVNAIVLSGGSSYGLQSAYGVMAWLREHNQGFKVGKHEGEVVPIVPGAIIFDLGRGGQFTATPDASFGYQAMQNVSSKAVKQGNVGAGTGAKSGHFKGGIGTASVVLDNGYTVGAIVALNSAGDAVNPDTCRFYAESLALENEFPQWVHDKCATQTKTKGSSGFPEQRESGSMNTTIAVVATDAPLDKAMLSRMALMAQDGLAIAIRPIHTLSDGDTVFAMSTGKKDTLSMQSQAHEINAIYVAGANTLARAVMHAMVNATSVGDMQSYCDTYKGRCP